MSTPTPVIPDKITKSFVDKQESPAAGQSFCRDIELKGFALRATAGGAKSFIIEKRIEGQVKHITLGRYPELTVEQARKEAHKLLGNIASGGNPVAEKQRDLMLQTSLSQAFTDFMEARKSLKPRTLYDYQRLMKVAFAGWQKRPPVDITVAESLDISAYALKRLVNHKMTNDVTAGYIVSDVERLRAPMQRITDYLLNQTGATFPSPSST